MCLGVFGVRVSSGLPQGQGLWVQSSWAWQKPSWRRSPLTHHKASRAYTGLRNRLWEGTDRTLWAPGPRGRSSDPTRDWPRLAHECPGISRRGMGWQCPAGLWRPNSWFCGCMMLEHLWGDTPRPRAKQKPQQDGRGVKPRLESNPIPARDAQRAQMNFVSTRTQRPHRDWDRTVFGCLLRMCGLAVDCCRGRGSGCCRPGHGRSPLGGGHH